MTSQRIPVACGRLSRAQHSPASTTSQARRFGPFIVGTIVGGVAGAVVGTALSSHTRGFVVGLYQLRSGDWHPQTTTGSASSCSCSRTGSRVNSRLIVARGTCLNGSATGFYALTRDPGNGNPPSADELLSRFAISPILVFGRFAGCRRYNLPRDGIHLRQTRGLSRRGAETDTARLRGRPGVAGDRVLVAGDANGVEQFLGFVSAQPDGADVDQHQVRVCAAGDDRQPAVNERLRHRPGVVDDAPGIVLESPGRALRRRRPPCQR